MYMYNRKISDSFVSYVVSYGKMIVCKFTPPFERPKIVTTLYLQTQVIVMIKCLKRILRTNLNLNQIDAVF